MQFERITSAGQLVAYTFMQDNVAASQTNVQLGVAQVDSAAGNAVDGYTMPFAGSIVAITADLSAAATAGTLTVGPTIAGTEKTDPTLSITTQTTRSDKAATRDTTRFVAGDVLGAEITSDGSWDGTTADLVVVVYVIFDVTGL